MGLAKFRTYFDSCLTIYVVEENPVFAPLIEAKLAAAPNVIICISDLTQMESLVMPLRQNNSALIQKFKEWFKTTEVLTLDNPIFQRAAKLRADFPSLKTPDALHVATALHHGCDEFWTNDNRLDRIAAGLVKNVLTP